MTPLEIEIILYYYGRADDFRGGDFNATAVKDTIDKFLHQDVLEPRGTPKSKQAHPRKYDLTERGLAFVTAVTALPLPQKTWVMPKQQDEE